MSRLNIRLSKEEKQELRDKAKAVGLDLSKYVRKQLGLKNKNMGEGMDN